MNVKQLTLKQSLNKAYRLIKPERAEIEKFKVNFRLLFSHINSHERQEGDIKSLVNRISTCKKRKSKSRYFSLRKGNR